jgi:methyl-accepting chemotaxis protein
VSQTSRSSLPRLWSGILARVAPPDTSAQAELLRQMGDVFKELAHLSVDLGALWSSLEETKKKLDEANARLDQLAGRLDTQAAAISELAATVNDEIDTANESTELLGRLLQSTRTRLDLLESRRSGAREPGMTVS